MNFTYLMYQAERPRTAAERRADAVRAGELAKAVSQVFRGRRDAVTAHPASSELPARPARPLRPARPALTLVREVASAPGTAHTPCACECRTAS
jgi:hypothetical protein